MKTKAKPNSSDGLGCSESSAIYAVYGRWREPTSSVSAFEKRAMRYFDVARCKDQIASLRHSSMTQDDVSPNDCAFSNAYELAEKLVLTFDELPDRIVTDVRGGVAFYFFSARRHSSVTCFNDGEIIALMVDHQRRQDAEVWEIDREADPCYEEALSKLLNFVGKPNAPERRHSS